MLSHQQYHSNLKHHLQPTELEEAAELEEGEEGFGGADVEEDEETAMEVNGS